MAFGYSDEIFPYPAVQYIPLQLYDNITREHTFINHDTYFHLFTSRDNIPLEYQYSVSPEQVAIMVINGEVDIIMYRGYRVIMVGHLQNNHYHIFKITKKYFYKDKLYFVFYNGENNEKLHQKSRQLKDL